MSNHSIIEHRANYHFVKVEEDYIAICLKGKTSPHCKALILAILEQWTNTKRDQGEEPIIYMTYPQWIKATYWYHGRNAIIESLQELEDIGFITRSPYRMYGKDTFAYVLNAETIQAHIKELPEKATGNNLPSFNLNAFKNKRVPNQTRPKSNGKGVYNQTPEAFNIERNIDTTTQLPNTTSEEDMNTSASAGSVALHTSNIRNLEVEKKRRETDPHIPVIRVSSHSQRLSETSKEEEEPTRAAKGHVHESTTSARAALPCVEHHLLAGDGESSEQEASATSEHITLQQPPDAGQVASAPAASTALGVSSPPPTSGVQQGAADHTPPKPRLKKTVIVKDTAGPPPFPSESEAWGTTTCLRLFDFWRGAPLCDVGQLKYASSCAKRLAETYNRKQVVIVRTAMNNQKFWEEQGGADVCDVARHMQKELNKLKMPTAPAQQQSPDQSRPTLEEVECIDPTWCVYQRPGDTQEWILWQGELLTEDEANDRGYAGGGGLYIQTQYA